MYPISVKFENSFMDLNIYFKKHFVVLFSELLIKQIDENTIKTLIDQNINTLNLVEAVDSDSIYVSNINPDKECADLFISATKMQYLIEKNKEIIRSSFYK